MPSPPPPCLPVTRRRLLVWPLVTVGGGLGLAATGLPAWASAPAIELQTLRLQRADGALSLDFAARIHLSRAVEEALQRGVPVYFTAQALLLRNRWYWRDERVARVQRTWRLAFQPLTSSWRVGIGGLNQTQATLEEALSSLSRLSGWRIADLAQVDPDSRHYVEFSFRLDTSQLPGPMQFGLTAQADWTLALERTLRLE
ncbi:MAG: DUF4390 domain-containing protein [Betaproteobacteria bacterium]